VDLFFVLSGFLITAPLLAEWSRYGSISFRAFWMRRSLRLLPALAVFVPVGAAAAIVVGDSGDVVSLSVLASIFYFMNFLMADHTPVASTLAHTWSLSVEEQFYLVWPIVFVVIVSRSAGRTALVRWLCLALVFFPLLRTVLYSSGADYTLMKVGPGSRFDLLAIGCLVAVIWCWDLVPAIVSRVRLALVPAVLFMLAVVLFGGPQWVGHLAVWGWSAIGLACAILILNALDPRNRTFNATLRWGPLGWLGRLSYGLYLWHFAILKLVRVWVPQAGPGMVAVLTVAASLGAAALSWRYVEAPFLALKGRISARQKELRVAG